MAVCDPKQYETLLRSDPALLKWTQANPRLWYGFTQLPATMSADFRQSLLSAMRTGRLSRSQKMELIRTTEVEENYQRAVHAGTYVAPAQHDLVRDLPITVWTGKDAHNTRLFRVSFTVPGAGWSGHFDLERGVFPLLQSHAAFDAPYPLKLSGKIVWVQGHYAIVGDVIGSSLVAP